MKKSYAARRLVKPPVRFSWKYVFRLGERAVCIVRCGYTQTFV